MRLISAVSGVQIPAPPPFLSLVTPLKIPNFRVKGGECSNLVSLLTLLVFCLGLAEPVWAQREVKPPASTPMDAKPVLAPPVQASTVPTITPKPEQTAKKQSEKPNKDTKPAPAQAGTEPKKGSKPEQTAKNQPEKPNKKTKPAPVQASITPAATDSQKAPKPVQSTKTQPEKAKKTAKQVATNEGTAKPKAKKSPRICKTNAKQEPGNVAQAKKSSTKVAKKTTQKPGTAGNDYPCRMTPLSHASNIVLAFR